MDVAFSGSVSGSILTVTGGKINITLVLKSSSRPDALQVKDSRLSGLFLYWGYSHTTFLDWANRHTCYAEEDNQIANQLCQHITNRKTRNGGGNGYNVYNFR